MWVDAYRNNGVSEFGEGVLDVVDGGGECCVGFGTVRVAGAAGDGVGGGEDVGEGRVCAFIAKVALHGVQVA